MIAGLISQSSCRVAWARVRQRQCRVRATRPATHRVTTSNQSCSSTTAHRPRMPNQRRQASHPSDARSTHSDPTAEDPGNIALSLIVAPCERPRCACNPQPLKSVEFIQRSWHARQKNDMRNLSDPLHCLRWLHRTQYGLGRRSIQTVGANAYPTATVQTALLIRQIGGPRASRLLLCVMPAERTLMHAQMRHCVSPRSCSWHPPWTNKTAISVPQHAKFSLRDYRPAPRPG